MCLRKLAILLVIFCVLIIFQINIAYAPPTPHNVNGKIFYENGTKVPSGTPVLLTLNSSTVKYRVYTSGPPGNGNSYSASVNGSDGDTVYVKSWNQTSYGVNTSTLSGAGTTYVNVSFNMTRSSEANTTAVTPTSNAFKDVSSAFNVTINITMLGNDSTACNASISFSNTSVLNVSLGYNLTQSIGNIAYNTVTNYNWSVYGKRRGVSNISINVSCASDSDVLEDSTNVTILNLTIVNYAPNQTFEVPTPANAITTTNTSVMINVSVDDIEQTTSFIDWNYTLTAWLAMDYSSGSTVYGNSSYLNNGTAIGNAAATADGIFGKGYSFDGDGDYIETNVTQGKASFSFWYKNVTGSWTHIANVSGTTYVNGAAASPSDYPLYVNGNTIQIGKLSASSFFNGTIDEVLVFSRNLSSQEVKALYDSSQYQLYNNFSNLVNFNYTYTTYSVDFDADTTITTRSVNISESAADLPPVINSNATSPATPVESDEVYIYANVTDADSSILWVNFTVIAPNSTKVLDNQNATSKSGDIWNSTSFVASAVGIWYWYINASDGNTITTSNGSFLISSWHIITGNLTGRLTLQDSNNKTLIHWNVTNATNSNIFIADSEGSVSFNDLLALSRNTSGSYMTNDFSELDTVISMSSSSDSVNSTFTLNGNPRATASFDIFGIAIDNVPILNSTNITDFVTGILWDSSDDIGNDEQYDSSDMEDVVFVTKSVSQKPGSYGTYDFEIRIPALLRQYIINNNESVSIYAELK